MPTDVSRKNNKYNGRGAVFKSTPCDDLEQMNMDERGYRRRGAGV